MPPTEPPPEWVLARRRVLGDRIRAARTARAMSQERLGELGGADRQTVNRIEQGHHATRIDTLFRIADALGVPLSDLVREERPPPPREAQGPLGLPDPGPP
ncbi:helix-turn-helix domain-containing protein [Streptomyces sp. OUCMDZ-4982]|uniref:helix-turn-helix transcriptional regulator n=1 Tax=Streptomyces sp. OUCMDZ-4982 TaxID=2973090 RepID=UPI00215C3352|nr:helix-turn-helix transcriptional regulator [Streptomyces sp. OUCMDZ-4982]MCR8943944.1 helix-turn-helix domain-containing protein [Streptomyces sp. OUCMDZ-4982]